MMAQTQSPVKEQQVWKDLTVEQASELLAKTKTPLYLCIGNVALVGHSGDVVDGARLDPDLLGRPISPAHTEIPVITELSNGLEMLRQNRRSWDATKKPKPDQVLTLKDEVARMLPTWTAPYL
jgi:hypothetical protein